MNKRTLTRKIYMRKYRKVKNTHRNLMNEMKDMDSLWSKKKPPIKSLNSEPHTHYLWGLKL